MEKTFKDLGLNEELLKSIKDLGFEKPTDVQTESIPLILDKKDLIVMSKTGSGKTGAFGLPILQCMSENPSAPEALILTPTRELAVQVEGDIKTAGKYTSVKTTSVYGQHNIGTEINALKSGVSIVTGTPGRVMDHIKRKTFNTKNIKFLVLDEADRMLDMGFIDQVVQIIKYLPRNRTTLLFSATMPPEIQHICKSYMKNPVNIELETDTMTVDSIEQSYYKVDRNEKRKWLNNILKLEQPDSCMVFCNTRYEVDRVCSFLTQKNYIAEGLHGANSQAARTKTMNRFKSGKIQVLVATDVAARGLHIDELSLVINYDLPEEHNSYVHRIGRTGRAGNTGKAISLVTTDTFMLMYEIEEHVGVLINEMPLPEQEEVNNAAKNANGKWVGIKPVTHGHKTHSTSKSTNGNKSSKHSGQNRSKSFKPSGKKTSSANQPDKKKATIKPSDTKHISAKTTETHAHKPSGKIKTPATKTDAMKKPVQEKPRVKDPLKTNIQKPKKTTPQVRHEKRYVKGFGEMTFVVKEPTEKKPTFWGRIKKSIKGD